MPLCRGVAVRGLNVVHRANRVIVWGSLLTALLVAACLTFPLLGLKPADGDRAAEVLTAISLMAAYLILVVGILAVGSSTYGNLALRRADAALDTQRNRRCFYVGAAFCIGALVFIFIAVL